MYKLASDILGDYETDSDSFFIHNPALRSLLCA